MHCAVLNTEALDLKCVAIKYMVTKYAGRGESHLLLCKQALQQNFDGKAVDHTSLALSDLVK